MANSYLILIFPIIITRYSLTIRIILANIVDIYSYYISKKLEAILLLFKDAILFIRLSLANAVFK